MKKSLQLLLLLILFAIPNLSTASTNKIQFLEVPFSEVQVQAEKSEKHFFTYFYGDWCIGCQIMDESTFTDKRLIQYIEANYIPSKVDVHSKLGEEWDKSFSISCMPTFIFFDSKGNVVDRYETTFTSSALLSILKQVREPDSQQSVAHINQQPTNLFDMPILDDREVSSKSTSTETSFTEPSANAYFDQLDQHILSLERLLSTQVGDPENEQTGKAIASSDTKLQEINTEILSLINHPHKKEYIEQQCQNLLSDPNSIKDLIGHLKKLKHLTSEETQQNTSLVMTSSTTTPKLKTDLKNTTAILKKSKARKVATKNYNVANFKVQVGYYKSFDNAVRKVNTMKQRFTNREVYLVTDSNNEVPGYHVLMSGFRSKYEAKSFVQSLKKLGYKAIVKLQ